MKFFAPNVESASVPVLDAMGNEKKTDKGQPILRPMTDEELAAALQNPEYKAIAPAISKDCLTLVKYKDEGILPLSPEKTKRVMIVNVKGPESPMGKLAAIAMGGGGLYAYKVSDENAQYLVIHNQIHSFLDMNQL